MNRIIFLFCLMNLLVYSSYSQDIAQWRGPNRDGIYQESGLLKSWPETGPVLLWHYDEIGEGHSSAAVTNDRIYTNGEINGIGYIFSFDLSGKLLWKIPYGEEWTESWQGVRSTPLIYDGKIYLMSGFGKLVCRKADNGDLIWTIDILKDFNAPNIKWGITENLLIDGNKLFCTPGGPEANVVAIDRNTGKLVWKCAAKGEASAYCSPALFSHNNRKILVTHTAGSIIGIDAENGKFLWSVDQPNTWSVHANTPVYIDGSVYCVSGYDKGGVMLKLSSDGSSVSETWRSPSISNRMGGFVVINGKILGSDDSGKAWYCTDWKTGTDMYHEKVTGKGNIISAEGLLYLYGDNGEVVLAQPTPTGFGKVSTFKVPFGTAQHWAHLVIKNGRLYVRHGNSLMAFDIRKK
ncbi:MAG: PQQ-binding-like beta-propeller repeat protein [Bacteroidetes bacterium]|nr:PQQ-binding-like beta-propeller repeat protein [Bacteroidota bacterium]